MRTHRLRTRLDRLSSIVKVSGEDRDRDRRRQVELQVRKDNGETLTDWETRQLKQLTVLFADEIRDRKRLSELYDKELLRFGSRAEVLSEEEKLEMAELEARVPKVYEITDDYEDVFGGYERYLSQNK